MDAEIVSAVLTDWKTAPVSEKMMSAFHLLEVMTLRPQEIDSAFISTLKSKGLNSSEMEEIASVAFHFNFINRVSDAVGFEALTDNQNDRHSKLLNLSARISSGGGPPQPVWTAGEDGVIRPAELNAAREQLLCYSGSVDVETRCAVESYTALQRGGIRTAVEITDALESFLKPLSLHAYRIHDELVDGLTDSGYTQEDLFEITLIGAFGAALPAQEFLYGVLYSDGAEVDTQETRG